MGVAKYLFEQELDFIEKVERQFKTISVRIYRVYGRGSRCVISRWVRSVLAGETIEAFGIDSEFDFIFADDVAEGLIRLDASQAGNVVNLGSGIPSSIYQVLRILEAIFPDIQINHLDSEYQKESNAADMYLFEHYTGWMPQTTLEAGIRNIIEYEQSK